MSTEALDARLRQAEVLVLSGDAEGFCAAVDALTAAVPCIDHIVSPPHAARLHRVVGLGAALALDEDRAAAAFAAARSLEPQAALLPDGTEPGDTLKTLYPGDPATGGATRPVAIPGHTTFLTDGTAATTISAHRPAVVQWSTSDHLGPSAYFSPLAGVALPPAPAPPPAQRRPALLWGAVGTATTALGLQLAARGLAARASAGTLDPARLDTLQPTVNTLSMSSLALGLTATGLGTAWLLDGRE